MNQPTVLNADPIARTFLRQLVILTLIVFAVHAVAAAVTADQEQAPVGMTLEAQDMAHIVPSQLEMMR